MSTSDLFDTFMCGSDVFYIDYKPIAPLSNRSTIEFLVPPSQINYIDLKKSRLCVSVTSKKKISAGTKADRRLYVTELL